MRNIEKAVSDYQQINRNGGAEIRVSDIVAIKRLAEEASGADVKERLYQAIVISLQAGVTIGYRLGKKGGKQ